MLNVKNAATRILVGIVILMTFSACETAKQGRVISTEDVREQPQVSPGGDVDVSAGRPMDEQVVSIEEFGSADFIPESLPMPTFREPELPEMGSAEVESPEEESPPEGESEELASVEVESELPPRAKETKDVDVLTNDDIKDDVEDEVETTPEVPDEGRKDSKLEHVFFGFDQYSIRQDAVSVLEKNAEMLNGLYKGDDVLIEGHCDERGTTDYNVELGKRRAQAVKDYLVDLGVEASRIRIVSYGKERPFCRESKPACWQQNRRAHFVLQ